MQDRSYCYRKRKQLLIHLLPICLAVQLEINQAFEDALDALGNPGLFGVGKKDADPELFKEKVSFIHTEVKPLFPFKAHVPSAGMVKSKPADNRNHLRSYLSRPMPDAEQTAVEDSKPVAEAWIKRTIV